MPTEVITWKPVAEGLPDAESNVLLALERGSTCEGFLDVAADGESPIFRDVCAIELADEKVTHWAEMPKGPNA